MRWRLVLMSLLATGSHAYAPIQWMKFPGKGIVLAPKGLGGRFRSLALPQPLTIRNSLDNMPSNMIPYFTVKPDKRIVWDDMDWCIEATGDKSGDTVQVNHCTGGASQRWNWIADGHGRYMIQLESTNKCLDVHDKLGWTGTAIELRECADRVTETWRFVESIPVPTQNYSQKLVFAFHLRHGMLVLMSLASVVSMSALFWRWRQKSPGYTSPRIDDGGVSLTVPAVMAVSSLEDGNTISSETVEAIPSQQPDAKKQGKSKGLGRIFSRSKVPDRAYASSETVGDSYDSWTSDGILEYYWGDHIHLGYYPKGRVLGENFIEAKAELTKQLFEWAVPDFKPVDAKLLDAGCGIGGSTRQLSRDYGFAEATGISLSEQQVRRATQLTTEKLKDSNVRFEQMDALNMRFEDETFDIVWSLEMEPHIPDKRKMCEELLRVLKPGGTLVLGGWNVRDDSMIPLSPFEHKQVTHLLEEWSHPNFWSIAQYVKVFESIPGVTVQSGDWTIYTHPSWMESITTMFKRPKGIFMAIGQGLRRPRLLKERVRDLYTLWDWHKAMGNGLMQFGVFSVTKQLDAKSKKSKSKSKA